MKLLIIGSNFYTYKKIIANEFSKRGFCVDDISQVYRLFFRHKKIFGIDYANKKNIKYLEKIVSSIKNYDLIITLVGEHLNSNFMQKLKNNNPSAKFILYLWDDINRIKNYEENCVFYDSIYSFSNLDSKTYNINFLPLFYSYNSEENSNKYLIYTALGNHSDREQVILSLIHNNPFIINNSKIILTVGLTKFCKYLLRGKLFRKPKCLKYKIFPLSFKKNNYYMSNSSCIFDVQFNGQIGLTMRTIETIGAQKKLITTNNEVKNYDFYNSTNILVVNRDNPIINDDFFKNRIIEYTNRCNYSIQTFVSVLLGQIKLNYLK